MEGRARGVSRIGEKGNTKTKTKKNHYSEIIYK
jgi:hypothetical protein